MKVKGECRRSVVGPEVWRWLTMRGPSQSIVGVGDPATGIVVADRSVVLSK